MNGLWHISFSVRAYYVYMNCETKSVLTEKDINQHVERLESEVIENSEFRIKWRRRDGKFARRLKQFMLIEDLYGSVEKIEKNLEQNMTNKVNIEFLQKQVEKMLEDIEMLKDKNREIVYKNGATQ